MFMCVCFMCCMLFEAICLLCCEGMARPIARGMIHLFIALLYPIAVYHLAVTAGESLNARIAVIVYLTSNLWCCGFSALYHIGKWSTKTEIFLQKLDYCGIAIFCSGATIPISVLLLPFTYGMTLGLLSVISCIWACWHVSNQRAEVWRLAVVACVILPFFPILYYHTNTVEFSCLVVNGLLQVVGAVNFTNKRPDPWPEVFGYHEVFHLCTFLGLTAIYICNWSVVHRTCNPCGASLYDAVFSVQHEGLAHTCSSVAGGSIA